MISPVTSPCALRRLAAASAGATTPSAAPARSVGEALSK